MTAKIKTPVIQLVVLTVLSLSIVSIVNNISRRQSLISQAQELSSDSSGYIPPTPIVNEETLQQASARLFGKLPVNDTYFKITFDYPAGKFSVVLSSNSVSKNKFISWLKSNNFYSLYPSSFLIR